MFKSMKTGVLAAILISTALIANAQKKVTEGTVNYEMKYYPTDGQEAIVAMLPTETASKFNSTIFKFETQNGPAKTTFIQNYLTNTGIVLLDVPVAQWQYAIKVNKEAQDKEKAESPKFSGFKATGEKKVIATYNAEKYTYTDDKGLNYELWTTTDIEMPAGFYGTEFNDVKGALLIYTNYVRGVKTLNTFTKLKEEKVGDLTIEVPKGYTVKTMEEIMAMIPGQ
ncbi:MAG: hypothetical protein EOO96_17890 [Pedobacter sp.]|nr:MAG: hypothetical protein EOO96_17890 [Pedobacter sp.]